eukprot:TRINITY_DN71849_c0_g1_i1.p1 TRINITY_DN71849_c0_g1~~TRINITY_DN71849_c0_g1_i1.p1  ORF type:complete len:216 (+),score=69.70 TRINITY_DN71849_c0_g1_i1:62-709(+)
MAALPAAAGQPGESEDRGAALSEDQLVALAALSNADAIHAELSALRAKLDFYTQVAVLQAMHGGLIGPLAGTLVEPCARLRDEQRQAMGQFVAAGNPLHGELSRKGEQLQRERLRLAAELQKLDSEESGLRERAEAAVTKLSGPRRQELQRISEDFNSRAAALCAPHRERIGRFQREVMPQWEAAVHRMQQQVAALVAAEQAAASPPPAARCAIM